MPTGLSPRHVVGVKKGYISQRLMVKLLEEHQLTLITRKNMHTKKPMLEGDQGFFRNRSPQNFVVNLLCGLRSGPILGAVLTKKPL